ncbi:MGMT family protein [Paracoccaceae bacterium]|nr:MGMT family protein [Paracoccaceae bacterium]
MQEKKFTKTINNRYCYGTKFQLAVWTEIAKIRRGTTKTYSELANVLGKPKSARAVANACGKNPYPGPIPCHRVIRSDGSLGGYSGLGGIETKRNLLQTEISNFK